MTKRELIEALDTVGADDLSVFCGGYEVVAVKLEGIESDTCFDEFIDLEVKF